MQATYQIRDRLPEPGFCSHLVKLNPRLMNSDWKQCKKSADPYLYTTADNGVAIQWVCEQCAKDSKISENKLSPEELTVAEVMLL